MDALGHQQFSVYGTDVGMPIAYAVAAEHRERVERLAASEAFLPGVPAGASLLRLLLRNPVANARLWHLAFNQLPAEVNEQQSRAPPTTSTAVSSSSSGDHTPLTTTPHRHSRHRRVVVLRRGPPSSNAPRN